MKLSFSRDSDLHKTHSVYNLYDKRQFSKDFFMETLRFGIVIRVRDLELCRQFYRDQLHLGEPAADSTFAVEFRPSESFSLRLEQSDAHYLEHASAATSWVVECDDPARLREELENAGMPVAAFKDERSSGDYFRCEDPEGNLFFIAARPKRR